MAIALTVLFTALIGSMAVALGVYLGRKLNRGSRGVTALTSEQVRMKRRVLRTLGVYLVALLVLGGAT